MMSEGVITPGKSGRPASCAAWCISLVSPGDTPNCAPAFFASAHCSGFVIVPTPTTISGASWLARSIACSPAPVRSVISSTFTPPAWSARDTCSPCSAESNASTGITGPRRTISLTFFICVPPDGCASLTYMSRLFGRLADKRTEHRSAHFRRRRSRTEDAEQFAAEADFVFRLMRGRSDLARGPFAGIDLDIEHPRFGVDHDRVARANLAERAGQ